MDPDHFGNPETELGDLMEGFGSYEFSCSKNYDELNVPFDYQFQSQIDDLGGTSNRVLQTDNPRDRKKRNDKEYRARCREAQKRQEEELEKLAVENERMKNENESLVKERVTVLSPKLESAAIEINRLRSESQSLKRSSDNQIILVHALTEKLVPFLRILVMIPLPIFDQFVLITLQVLVLYSLAHLKLHSHLQPLELHLRLWIHLHVSLSVFDSQNKLRSLHDEVARLRQNVPQDPRMQEKKKLMEELLRLENENKLLELQNQAYCMMIQNDGDPRGDEADQASPAGLL